MRNSCIRLSFRNLARFILIQENEIQKKDSPFCSGQYTTKTSELATIKLLLTGIDDSAVNVVNEKSSNNTAQIELIDELLAELFIENMAKDRKELTSQSTYLEDSIEHQRQTLICAQQQLDLLLQQRKQAFEEQNRIQERLDQISELLARFTLLRKHYVVDIDRLKSIQESGIIFKYIDVMPCPHCGANPAHQNSEQTCNGDVDSIVTSATAEIEKIEQLLIELNGTISDLLNEADGLKIHYRNSETIYQNLDKNIREIIAPKIDGYRSSYTELIDKRAEVQKSVDLFSQLDRLESKKTTLQRNVPIKKENKNSLVDMSNSITHKLSLKISSILKAWDFPGDCHVYYEKKDSDFVIDGKPRGNQGKGLRAISHAAVSIALLEFCQENELPHPGFLVLDSPLLAYYKPEGKDDFALQCTDLKVKFYDYLIHQHSQNWPFWITLIKVFY
ncbi:hypothetical protein [Arsenophonus sp. PmNCSU2021_1]|uniref:hypothetical protein n=1 Tax=Arsenophonus sp. PmNCSU2021_1 TaxID=3118989 RepID=UPI002FF0328C